MSESSTLIRNKGENDSLEENITAGPPIVDEIPSGFFSNIPRYYAIYTQDDDDAETRERCRAASCGAGIVTGICGFLLGGPLLGACMGLSCAYVAAHDKEGPVGVTARTVGDATMYIHRKAKEVDKTYGLGDKAGRVTKNALKGVSGMILKASDNLTQQPWEQRKPRKRQPWEKNDAVPMSSYKTEIYVNPNLSRDSSSIIDDQSVLSRTAFAI